MHINADNTFFQSEDEVRLMRDLEQENFTISPDRLLSSSYTLQDLRQDAQIGINLENRPFQNPKVRINLTEEMPYTQEATTEEISRFDITGVADGITLESIVNKLAIGNQEALSSFHKRVYQAYEEEINNRVEEKLKLSEEKKKQSEDERNKEC